MSAERTQINLRVDRKLRSLIEQLRREEDPIPSASDVIRQAIVEKAARKGRRTTRKVHSEAGDE